MLTVRDLLERKGRLLWTVAADASVYTALELMSEKDVGALPVVADGHLVGIFSERDFARKVDLKGLSARETRVRDHMTRQVYFVRPECSLEDCMRLMSAKHIRHLPVLDRGGLMGILEIGDVMSALVAQKDLITKAQRDTMALETQLELEEVDLEKIGSLRR
ncbi:MAG: CBS domain-containing protein [Bacteroidetes bacterium]|nr:MAG: CBS domain-containing protein [Bacteroidota bacterium]